MSLEIIFHALIAFGALQAIFLAVILVSQKKNISSRLFSFFLAIEGLILIERLLADTGLMSQFPHILGVGYPISFLKPPILFILALALLDSSFRIEKKHIFHTIPFFLITLTQLPFFLLPGSEKIIRVSAFINYVPTYTEFVFWFIFSFFVYIGIYLYRSIRAIRSYQQHIKNNTQANWYLKILYLYSAFLLVSLFQYMIRPTGLFEIPFVNTINMLMMTFIIQSIAYIFLTRSQMLSPSNGRALEKVDQLSIFGDQIKKKLVEEKVYLDDTLSLEAFSASMGLSKKFVSDVINQNFGTSFKSLINQYRVDEAISLMTLEKGKRTQLVQIGLKSGFNNKVSFYRTFKKQTGKSPTDYFQSISKR